MCVHFKQERQDIFEGIAAANLKESRGACRLF